MWEKSDIEELNDEVEILGNNFEEFVEKFWGE